MEGTRSRHQQRFIDADMREAVGLLVAIIRQLRPHVVVTYDPDGGYGHPDHIQAHRVTTEAVAASATDDYPGAPWQVPKFYWTVMATSAMAAGLAQLDEVPDGWTRVSIDDVPFGYPDDKIDAVIDAREQLPAKVAAAAGPRHSGHRRPERQVMRAVQQHRAADPHRRALHTCVRHTGRTRPPRLGDRPPRRIGPRITRSHPVRFDRVAAETKDSHGPGSGSQPAALAGPPGQLPVGGRLTRVGARQHSDLSLSPDDARALRAVVLTLLAVDGIISAVLAAFFLPLRLGAVPFPISALLSGVLNAALVWAALQWTSSPRLAALPLWAWLATVAGLTFPGPGDDAVFSAEWALLLLIVVGALPPALLLYRRTRPR